MHRISAASCYHKVGDPGLAANLYRAALTGPLRAATRRDVQRMLAECLAELALQTTLRQRGGKATAQA